MSADDGSCCEPKVRWQDIYGDAVRPRRFGFELPPDPLQVGAWFVICILLALYVVLHMWILKEMSLTAFIVVSAVLGVLGLSTIVLKIFLSSTDISCHGVLDGSERLDGEALHISNAGENEKPCSFCRVFVPKTARHCSTCDKCVEDFDHHCRWLNSCVGKSNYKPFFTFMCCAWLSIVVELCVAITTFVWTCVYLERANEALADVYNSSGNLRLDIMFLVVTAAGMCLEVLGLGGLTHLVGFHIGLIRSGETTFTRIERKRQQKKLAGTYQRKSEGCCGVEKRRTYPPKPVGGAPPPSGDDGGFQSGGASEMVPVHSAQPY